MTPLEDPPNPSHEAREALRERFQLDAIHVDYLMKQHVALHHIRAFSIAETTTLRREWEKIYIPPHEKHVPLHRCTFCGRGRERVYASSFNWHTFSYGLFPCTTLDSREERENALRSLESQEPMLVLMWEPCGYRALEVPTAIAKQLIFDDDLYLFPRSLAWIYVGTHEPWSFYAKQTDRPGGGIAG